MMDNLETSWVINSDIYDIGDNINNLKKRYMEDEEETTLSMGIYGFIGDLEAKKIQIATIQTGQLGNEMFPNRAKLSKNILAHAVNNNIESINAIPAQITVTLCIKLDDIDQYINDDNKFYIEAEAPIFIDNYEFHFPFDVMITRKKTTNSYSFSAQYVISDENDQPIINRLVNITNPYLKQPFIIGIGNDSYLGIQTTIYQYTIETIEDIMISDSVIANKTYSFQFDNQIADFYVTIEQNEKTYNIVPYIYGSNIDDTVDYYCWYTYTAEDTIRITFDSASFLPQLNSKLIIKSYTTLGEGGNFDYLNIDKESEGLYIDVAADHQPYSSLIMYLEAVSNSENGKNRKSKDELKKLVPKAMLSRGAISSEADLNNYFDLINTDENRLVATRKVDNQLTRTWYTHLILKDDENNMVPTNTIDLLFDINNEYIVLCDDGRYILPAGSVLKYDPDTNIATVIDDSDVPAINTDEYFNSGYYYMNIYNVVLCKNPLYSAFYLTNKNYTSYFTYEYVNDESDIQFIANRYHFERDLLIDQDTYKLTFNIAQSIIDNNIILFNTEQVTYVDDTGNTVTENIITENLKVVLVFYKNEAPYRWAEAELYNRDDSAAIYYFKENIITDSQMNSENNIRILNLFEAGSNNRLYGYFEPTTTMDMYILARLPENTEMSYPRKDLDSIAPGYEDFIVTNIYRTNVGLSLFDNYTNITNSKVTSLDDEGTKFSVSSVPCIGRHYMIDETKVKYLLDAIDEKKDYIDNCISLLDQVTIDYKFYNTYGPSITYKLEDLTTSIGHIDMKLKFKISLKDNSDVSTKPNIIQSIKSMIEDLNEIDDWHFSNLIQDIMNDYEDRINFIEFLGFNTFGSDVQHIVKIDSDDPLVVPEFLCIRNIYNPETEALEPCIEIETVE